MILKIAPSWIKGIARLGDYLHLPLNSERLQKLTENYVVSNAKIVAAMGKSLPVSSKEGLLKTFESFKSLMHYIIITLVLFSLELIYFKIADKYNIIDKPNHRSSHSSITLRGGGIIFPIAILIAFLLGYVSWTVTLAVVLVAIVSFIDDIKPLSPLPRFGSHILAVLLIAYDLHLFQEVFWVLPLVMILLIGWINAFNFMDGINGITVLYALVAIASFSVLPIHESSLPLLITMGLSCFVFGFFNVRKSAKTFAGDVGSISMAVFLGYFLFKTILETGQIGYICSFPFMVLTPLLRFFTGLKKGKIYWNPIVPICTNTSPMSGGILILSYRSFMLFCNCL